MSIDTSVAAIITAIEAHNAALNRNSDLLERVVAFQEKAIDKLEGSPTTKTTRSRKAKEEAPPVADGSDAAGNSAGASAGTESAAAAATASEQGGGAVADIVAGIGADADNLKKYALAWTAAADAADSAAENKRRVELLRGIADKLGTGLTFAELMPHVTQVVFYIERDKALPGQVDFDADYDFGADPAQRVAAAPSADEFG